MRTASDQQMLVISLPLEKNRKSDVLQVCPVKSKESSASVKSRPNSIGNRLVIFKQMYCTFVHCTLKTRIPISEDPWATIAHPLIQIKNACSNVFILTSPNPLTKQGYLLKIKLFWYLAVP